MVELALLCGKCSDTHENLPSLLQRFICIDMCLAPSALPEVVRLIGMTRQKSSGVFLLIPLQFLSPEQIKDSNGSAVR